MKKTLLLSLLLPLLFFSCKPDIEPIPNFEKEITITSNNITLEGNLYNNNLFISYHQWIKDNNYRQSVTIKENESYSLQYWNPNKPTAIDTLKIKYNTGNLFIFNITIDPSVDIIEDEIIFSFE